MTQILPAATRGATAPGVPGATATEGNAAASARALASDFETFLRMLTTQLQNQDPLNPMQSSDFAMQLATFSNVEQGVRTNELLESMLTRTAMGELAGLVGMSVRSEGPARFDGRPVELHLPELPEVESARLVVRDGLGQIVDSTDMPKEGGAHIWRGFGADGLPLPQGSYSFQLVGYAEGQPIENATVESFARVIEARRDVDGTRLVLEGGREIALDAVTAMRGVSTQ